MQEALLDLIFSVLRIKMPSFTDAFLTGKRLTGMCQPYSFEIVLKLRSSVYNRTQQATADLQDGIEENDQPGPLNMVDHFVAFILAALLESGLLTVGFPFYCFAGSADASGFDHIDRGRQSVIPQSYPTTRRDPKACQSDYATTIRGG
jgi:hypothetical protein